MIPSNAKTRTIIFTIPIPPFFIFFPQAQQLEDAPPLAATGHDGAVATHGIRLIRRPQPQQLQGQGPLPSTAHGRDATAEADGVELQVGLASHGNFRDHSKKFSDKTSDHHFHKENDDRT